MGDCKHCHQPAGLFRKSHKECVETFDAGRLSILEAGKQAAMGTISLDLVDLEVKSQEASYVTRDVAREVLCEAWEEAVNDVLEDGVMSQEEENSLGHYLTKFGLVQADFKESGAYWKMVKAGVIRDLLEGKLPDRLSITSGLPFQFQKGESLIWLFQGVSYLEDRTRTRFTGSSSGVGLRIAKGVYYRMGSFRGEPVRTVERVLVDVGLLAVTQKHIYFSGSGKAIRIRHDKIIALQPYSDGVGIQRDAMTAKPIVMVTGDGWFTQNLLANAANAGEDSQSNQDE